MLIKPFNAANSELRQGINLIEASAGTGKTYTIAMLILRFVVELELDIKQLLVVTFTKAATEELKERIRNRLTEARLALKSDENPSDITLKQWLDSLNLEKHTIKQRLDLALLDIDQAPIYTIHSFCQRVLMENALQSGQMFNSELSSNISALNLACAEDFWRKQLYARPLWQVALLTACFPTPEALLASINRIQLRQSIYPQNFDLEQCLACLADLLKKAAENLPDILGKLDLAFQENTFNDSFIKIVNAHRDSFRIWLAKPDSNIFDLSWITSRGVFNGLNTRKFLVSKAKLLPSDQQKQLYLNSLAIDCGIFDDLSIALQQLQVDFRRSLLEYLRVNLDKTLQQNNVLSFDTLISSLHEALTKEHAHKLIEELQLRFKAALIDEFQDTDNKQWQIFSRIFATSSHYLFLIGDPKQAIYKFRGADIYSYFQAHQTANHHYTLLHNWRSHPDLVTAINQLFNRNKPFLFDHLPYHHVNAARDFSDGKIGGEAPLILWQLDKQNANLEHWTSGKAASAIKDAVVNEILALLNHATPIDTKRSSCPVQPKDIAILVRTNSQALDYQQALNNVGIPAVLNSKQSVFASHQAIELYSVLQAIAQPGHVSAVKQALTVSWFNLDGQMLYRLINDEAAMDSWLSRFQDYHQLWQQQGLLCMMQQLLQQEQVEIHLSRQTLPERALTNLLHLIERLQQAAIDEHLSINKTMDWLLHAIQHATEDNHEDALLRLETDRDTVKIVTLHSAKGLEYAVVFCPNLWLRSDRLRSETNQIFCHENGEMIADLGSKDFFRRREQAIWEELAEDLRLCYVAVTRAKYRCYLAWADVRSKTAENDSALAYLLEFAGTDFASQQHQLMMLAAKHANAFQYRLLTAPTNLNGHYQPPIRQQNLTYQRRKRILQTDWQMSSYTSISSLSVHDTPELPADKAVEPEDIVEDIFFRSESLPRQIPSSTEATQQENDISFASSSSENFEPPNYAGLPRGAQLGNVIHYLLETISFQSLSANENNSLIRDQAIMRYGLKIESPDLIDQMLKTVVNTPLDKDKDFRLKNLAESCCLKEMPFYLSLQSIDTAKINSILQVSPAYQALSSKQMRGYLTGFIDLICLFQGKYYLLDYKTNCLPDYTDNFLLEAMRVHNYGLQYWLYSLVLDNYLQQRLPDYEFHRHFGGVKYLFVRGMREDVPGVGVFTDLPDQETIRKLGKLFFG